MPDRDAIAGIRTGPGPVTYLPAASGEKLASVPAG